MMWNERCVIIHFLIEDNSTKVLKHQVSFISFVILHYTLHECHLAKKQH